MIDDAKFILINFHNANIENNKLFASSEMENLWENFGLTKDKPIISVYGFNLFLNRSLEVKGSNHCRNPRDNPID